MRGNAFFSMIYFLLLRTVASVFFLIIYPKGEFYVSEIFLVGVGSVISLLPLFLFITLSKVAGLSPLPPIVAGYVALLFFVTLHFTIILSSEAEPKILALLYSHQYDVFINLIICIAFSCYSIWIKIREKKSYQ